MKNRKIRILGVHFIMLLFQRPLEKGLKKVWGYTAVLIEMKA